MESEADSFAFSPPLQDLESINRKLFLFAMQLHCEPVREQSLEHFRDLATRAFRGDRRGDVEPLRGDPFRTRDLIKLQPVRHHNIIFQRKIVAANLRAVEVQPDADLPRALVSRRADGGDLKFRLGLAESSGGGEQR